MANRIIEVNHRLNNYKARAKDRLNSGQGLVHHKRRCIEPEAVFGQLKANMGYRRFRYMGPEWVKMDFAFPAMAFNPKKRASNWPKRRKTPRRGISILNLNLICFYVFEKLKSRVSR